MLRWGLALCTCIVSGVAWAQPANTAPAAQPDKPADKPSDAPLPSCLDQTLKDQLGADLKPRGVQKRNFIKAHKIELVAHGGIYGGDLTSSSWFAGGTLGYWLTEDFGINAEFDLTPLTLDLDAPLNKFFGDNRFEPGMAYVALGNASWAPIHAKMKMAGGIVHADMILFAGAGRMFHDAVQGLSYDAGGALELFVTKIVTIRFDFRDLIAIEEVAGQGRITNNFIATAGLAIWIPTGL